MKIKKGDTIVVLAGKDKGKEGKVVKAIPKEESVVVEGVNMRKKSQKARRQGQKGQIIEFAHPLHISNIAIKDPKTGKASRVGYKIEGGKKVRVAKKSGTTI